MASPLTTARATLHNHIGGSVSLLIHRGISYPSPRSSQGHRLQACSHRSLGFRCKSSGSTQPVPELMLHHAWDFFTMTDIIAICHAAPVMRCYGALRAEASRLTLPKLRRILLRLNHNLSPSTICPRRSREVASLLLLCDFRIGGLIRCLRGLYTGDFLDFDLIDSTLAAMATIPVPPDEPQHDFSKIHDIFHHGVPLHGCHSCDRRDIFQRNLYNNHRAADPYLTSIHEKSAIDVQKSYAIALPRWTLRFVNGFFLAALGYAIREHKCKIKGRQCNDPSAKVAGPSDTGAYNLHLDKKNRTQVPRVYYQTALRRLWSRIYNLRVSYPTDDIIVYKDDLVAAFRRVRYHPDLAAANAFILGSFFMIPIGMVFGARDSPSWFCMISELRSLASRYLNILPIPIPSSTLIDSVTFAHPTPLPESVQPAQPDSYNQGTDGSHPGHQPTFVDDTMIAELRSVIREAASASAITAAVFIGSGDCVDDPISREKFERLFTHVNETLGFMIDTRSMRAFYPAYKQQSVLDILSSQPWVPNSCHKVRALARLLGKLRNLSQILPFGAHLSIHLQLCLSAYIKRRTSSTPTQAAFRRALKKAWGSHCSVHINAAAAHDLQNLTQLLSGADQSIWERPLSLLVSRDPHFSGLSDASNLAMGGFSFELPFQWRISNAVFRSLPAWQTPDPSAPEHHINIHEFIGILVNVFFLMLVFCHMHHIQHPNIPNVDGFIFRVAADNTSALSWMTHASRSREPKLVNLVYLLSHITFHFNSIHASRFDASHIQGKLNVQADALSRPQDHPSYLNVFNSYPEMKSLPAYRVPQRLLSAINACLSSLSTRVPSKPEIAALFSVKLSSLQLTAPGWESQTLL